MLEYHRPACQKDAGLAANLSFRNVWRTRKTRLRGTELLIVGIALNLFGFKLPEYYFLRAY